MRVSIILAPGEMKQHVIFPLDFRRHFISLIKSMLENSLVFNRFKQERPGYSPYVFSVNFQKIVDIDTRTQQMCVRPPVYLLFSTGIYEVMTALCNGAISLRGQNTILGLKLRYINLLPLKEIKSSPQVFKIRGHAVLRGRNGYINAAESTVEELEEAINTHLLKQHEFLRQEYGQSLSPRIGKIKVIPSASSYHKGVCSHYGGWLTTLQGSIALDGSADSLQFLYNFGLGVRTGQGFGLLEVR
ncbi:MAG: hypothetical protein H0Z35_07800 [Thermoanaerobacteraceae bacterium]|nr:hypothetical protein [Thermoanaerobacteraceae bacterium]